jgi:predicted N-formylglutamate amidohydrolase
MLFAGGTPATRHSGQDKKTMDENSQDAVEVVNSNGRFPCLLVCDHAAAELPPEYGNLGLGEEALTQHIALDIGIAPVVRALSILLDAPAVLTRYSRLLIDTNRWIEDSESIPATSDGIVVPGNTRLSEKERLTRQDRYFWPFHKAVHAAVEKLRARHTAPFFVAIHSCTRQMNTGQQRAMDGGTIWHEQPQLARLLADALSDERDILIGDNAPYSGIGGGAFTIDYHTWGTGLPACGVEVVNDGLKTSRDQAQWTHLLAHAIETASEAKRFADALSIPAAQASGAAPSAGTQRQLQPASLRPELPVERPGAPAVRSAVSSN